VIFIIFKTEIDHHLRQAQVNTLPE